MSQKIEIPKSFAICFVGGDKNKTNEQFNYRNRF